MKGNNLNTMVNVERRENGKYEVSVMFRYNTYRYISTSKNACERFLDTESKSTARVSYVNSAEPLTKRMAAYYLYFECLFENGIKLKNKEK